MWEIRMDANRSATALLIDEDPGSQQANQQRLEGDGFTVVLARDVNSGLAQARHLLPGVIFIHLVSGEAGSVSFIQALRAEDSCRHIRVVVLRTPAVSAGAKKQLRAVPRDGW
jgi:ActR/RegA family two-component response regulator